MLQYHKFLPQDTYSSLPTTQGRRNPHGPMNGPIDPPKFSLIRNKSQTRSKRGSFYDWPPQSYLQSDTPDLYVTAKKPITRYEYVQGATD